MTGARPVGRLEQPFRQVHLDFHTSELIAPVAHEFDPEAFAAALQKARVNSVTCFSRCHHGWMYYDTQAFPERRHPGLNRDLLREQIEACHRRGIRVPIYTTVQWDHYTASEHPDWLMIDPEGRPVGTPPLEAGFNRTLCVNSPYRELIKAMTSEILRLLPVDGLFFDIVGRGECVCKYCRAAMAEHGLEPADPRARREFALRTHNAFVLEMSGLVRGFDDTCPTYFNYKNVGPGNMGAAAGFTHYEFDALPGDPTVGYTRFPTLVRFFRASGKECLGHTGKFHTTWGDFHSYKNLAALEYECFHLLALGAKCVVGDQLHPSGRLDGAVYDLIESVYSDIERKEPWCRGATALAEIGVLSPEEFAPNETVLLGSAISGAARMLQEGACQFDVVDSAADFGRYSVLVLPDVIPVDAELGQKLDRYVAAGGAIVASFESGLNRQKSEFSLGSLGVTLGASATRDLDGKLVRGRPFPNNDYADYILPRGAIGRGLPETEHVMYVRGVEVDVEPGAQVLAEAVLPYFDRTYRHFCSHRQTPSSGRRGGAAVVRRGQAVYFVHPIFSQYDQNAPRWCKTLFLNALAMLLPDPLLTHDGPSTVLTTVNQQAPARRWVLHLLHYIPERRGRAMDVVEDVIPLHQVAVSVRVPGDVRSITLVPQMKDLPFELRDGRAEFVVPRVVGHQMIAIAFGGSESGQ